MSIIKPRTRGKVFVEQRTRLDRTNHETLYAYAAFLDEDVDYVMNQLIESVLERDREFSAWRAEHQQSYAPPRVVRPRAGAHTAISKRPADVVQQRPVASANR